MFHFILNRYEYAVFVYLCIISLPECNFRKVGICNRCILLGLQLMTRAPSLSLCSLNEFPVPLLSPTPMLPSYQHLNKVFSLETVKQFSLYRIPLLCMALSFSISSWSYFFFFPECYLHRIFNLFPPHFLQSDFHFCGSLGILLLRAHRMSAPRICDAPKIAPQARCLSELQDHVPTSDKLSPPAFSHYAPRSIKSSLSFPHLLIHAPHRRKWHPLVQMTDPTHSQQLPLPHFRFPTSASSRSPPETHPQLLLFC